MAAAWLIRLTSPANPISAAGQRAGRAVREAPAPRACPRGRPAADFADQGAAIAATLPAALAILVFIFQDGRLAGLLSYSRQGGIEETNFVILLAVAIGAFTTSRLVFLEELGLGVAAAVLIDAFVARAVLVPALMALLGEPGTGCHSPVM